MPTVLVWSRHYCCILEVRVMTTEELLERYAAGERDFSGVDLRGVNLSGANLYGVMLYDADLRGANLGGANLNGTKLSSADLRNADLSNTNLSESNLCGAKLVGCNFRGTDLTNAGWCGDLTNVDLSGAENFFTGEDFMEVTFCNTTLPDGRIANGPVDEWEWHRQ